MQQRCTSRYCIQLAVRFDIPAKKLPCQAYMHMEACKSNRIVQLTGCGPICNIDLELLVPESPDMCNSGKEHLKKRPKVVVRDVRKKQL